MLSLERKKRPIQKRIIPVLPIMAGLIFSIIYPASGPIINAATGQGVINNPVMTSVMPIVFCKKKGNEIIANICAIKEPIEAKIDNLKIGMRIRSTGSKGVCCFNWRCRK